MTLTIKQKLQLSSHEMGLFSFMGHDLIHGEYNQDYQDNSEPSLLSNKVIVFNDYFSTTQIQFEERTFTNNVTIEIRNINDFWNTSICNSLSLEYIILPTDINLKPKEIIDLVGGYIVMKLTSNYSLEDIDEYLNNFNTLIHTFTSLDTIDFNKVVVFNTDDNVIMNEQEESDVEIEKDIEIDALNSDESDSLIESDESD